MIAMMIEFLKYYLTCMYYNKYSTCDITSDSMYCSYY